MNEKTVYPREFCDVAEEEEDKTTTVIRKCKVRIDVWGKKIELKKSKMCEDEKHRVEKRNGGKKPWKEMELN